MTGQDIATLIESRIESSEPQTTIVNYLKTREGKPLTVRDEKALKEQTGDENLYIRKQYGMTHLEWGGYGRSGGNKGGSLLLAHSEKGVIIDMDYIMSHNVAYFGAAVERNAKRRAALAQPAILDEVATLAASILAAKKRLAELFAYGEPLSPDQYAIEELVGLSEKRR